ncbi:MAG: TIGR03087 family PEP-CTERM/XrtA system glycosyltransferase [Betaproteobacteria bacterium]
MSNILYLVHRLPYPPNKGDKVRSFHLLKHLAARHQVFLGTFIDDPEDELHVSALREMVAGLHISRLNPRLAKVRSLTGLLTGQALTLPYYRDGKIRRWVERTCRQQKIDAAVVFSSAMAQYVEKLPRLPVIVDFVDVDSAKWTQYAPNHRWPMSWLYRREGERLLGYERHIAARATRSFFVTEKETELFRERAPECGMRIAPMCNGVDSEFFSPEVECASPFAPDEISLVFTGAMDYWPNVDAAAWFSREVMPSLIAAHPRVRFYIVGRNPAPAVQVLADNFTVVTGTVPDVRPYLRHATAVVAPLRIARGIQNKILEAMAMAKPVITTEACAGAIDATPGRDFLVADTMVGYCQQLNEILGLPDRGATMGAAARARVVERYGWEAHLSAIERYLVTDRRLEPA